MPQVSDNFGPLYQSVVLDGSGAGSVSFQANGSNIRLTNITFFVSAVVKQAQVAVYKGQVAPGNRIFNSNSGSTGTSATGNIDLFDGETCFVVWTGGDAGATATATFVGGKIPFGDIRPSALTSQEPVAAGDGSLIYPALKSPNYQPGVTGWNLDRNGDADLNNVDVRGELHVNGTNNSHLDLSNDPVLGFTPTIAFTPGDIGAPYDASKAQGDIYAGIDNSNAPLPRGFLRLRSPSWSTPAVGTSEAIIVMLSQDYAGTANPQIVFVSGANALNPNSLDVDMKSNLLVEGTFQYTSAYGAFAGNIPTGIVTTVTPTSMLANNYGIWTAGTAFTIPVAGTYRVGCIFKYATNNTGQRQARVEKNATDLAYALFDAAAASIAGANQSVQVDTIENFVAGDVVTFRTFQTSGVALAVVHGRMWVQRVPV